MALPLPFATAELRYRTLTHVNPGFCVVELHDQPDGRGVLAVASTARRSSPADGPSLVNGAAAIATGIQRDLLPGDGGGGELTLVLRTAAGARLVTFAESFAGWFGRPSFAALTSEQLDALGPMSRAAAG